MELYLQAALTLTLGYCTWSALSLWQNRAIARRLGLPYVLLPASDLNVPLRYSIILRALYISPLVKNYNSFFLDYISQRWRWTIGYKWHEKFGPVFLAVTPGAIAVNVADPAVAHQILTHGKSFEKPVWLYKLMEPFGPNVITTGGNTWAFHRRITMPPFNASIHPTVWASASELAQQVKETWLRDGGHPTSLVQELSTVTLYVISAAGFGVSLRYGEDLGDGKSWAEGGKRLGYERSLHILTKNIHEIVFFPRAVLHWSPIRELRVAGQAADEFEFYIKELLEKDTSGAVVTALQESTSSSAPRKNLLQNLLESAQSADAEEFPPPSAGEKRKKLGFSTTEIVGNAFAFLFAGHESMGNTLQVAILMLAIYPDKQAWLCREIDEAMAAVNGQWTLEETYAHLSCVLCVMYEVLRIFPPLPCIPKWTGATPETLIVENKPRQLLPETYVMIAAGAIHNAPHLWGSDATLGRGFFPERWHIPSTPSSAWPMSTETEPISSTLPLSNVRKPIPGSFIPFSDGIRGCLGRRFAELEFTATLATLFLDCRVELVCRDGETEAACKTRAREAIDGGIVSVNLAMHESVDVRWVKRK